jgi:hypothetical protein
MRLSISQSRRRRVLNGVSSRLSSFIIRCLPQSCRRPVPPRRHRDTEKIQPLGRNFAPLRLQFQDFLRDSVTSW